MKNIEILGKSNEVVFGANGMQELFNVHLHRGTKIFAFGYAGAIQNFVVYDEEMNAVEIGDANNLDEYDLENYFSPLHKLESTIRPFSKKFGIGFYYDESGELVSDEIIEKSLERAKALEELRKRVEEEKNEENKREIEQLKKDFSYLERVDSKNRHDHKLCGRNIRAELKKNFPNTKFSVRYSSFSGGDEYSITWNDGALPKEVKAIVDKYQEKHPDAYSCGDYWDYMPSNFNDLFGGVSYIMTQRTISDEGLKTAEKFLKENYPHIDEENWKCYHRDVIGVGYTPYDYREFLYKVANQIDFESLKKEEKSNKAQTSGEYQIIDYSEKAIALVGDTKAIKDQLKALGGRFNPKLSCGCGWVFPKTKLQEVKEALNLDVVEEKSKETTNDYKKLLDSVELIDEYYRKNSVGAIMIDGYPFLISKPSIKTDFCFHDEGPDYEHYKDVTKDNNSLEEHFLSENFRDFDWKLKKLKDETSFIYKEFSDYFKTISIHFDCYGWEREKYKDKEITKEERAELIKALEYGRKCLEKRLQTYIKKYGTSKINTWTYWADR